MGGRFGELLLLFIVAMLLFGPQKLPDLAKALGEAIREFKKAASGEGSTPAAPAAPAQPAAPQAQIQAQAPPAPAPAETKPTDPPSSVVS
jgi:sec-independent protein translocase protein TatA